MSSTASATESAKAAPSKVPDEIPKDLPYFPSNFTVYYLTDEAAVNDALQTIIDGAVGFDTEFAPRRPTPEEAIINEVFTLISGSRKNAILGWQVLEKHSHPNFPIAWTTMGLRTVQLCRDDCVWIVNLHKMRAFPRELKRILTSPDIAKVGAGLANDISVIWNDLRVDVAHLVDVGLMARLQLAPDYGETNFGNLSLQTCAAEILGYQLDKGLATSDWSGDLSEAQLTYAATDAAVSLMLHRQLESDLAEKAVDIRQPIYPGWYSFNSTYGEPTRIVRNVRGERVLWTTRDCPWFFSGKFQGYFM
ncbi:ribonuclease H-like domain-containing protein [Mycena rebaudengoi]|nr:ribonuclease H-like domain-containing protein [Mycena rebaudengoi]